MASRPNAGKGVQPLRPPAQEKCSRRRSTSRRLIDPTEGPRMISKEATQSTAGTAQARRRAAWLTGALLLIALALPAASPAALLTVGSPLSVPATLNTAENL